MVVKGYKYSQEQKDRIRIGTIKAMANPELRKRLSDKLKGKPAWNKGLTKETNLSLKNASNSQTGRKRTLETRRKISKIQTGKIMSAEQKKKISNSLKKYILKNNPNNLFKKGMSSWNKGKKGTYNISEKHKAKIKLAHLNKKINWNKKSSTIQCRIWHLQDYKKWRSDCFERDNWTCQTCGQRGKDIEVHHIKKLNTIIKENKICDAQSAVNCKELWDLNNGVTLCRNCHKLIHNYKRNDKNVC